jgi:hypothetical protein
MTEAAACENHNARTTNECITRAYNVIRSQDKRRKFPMANGKLKVLSGATRLQPEAGPAIEPGVARDKGPTAEEGLRLLMAFIHIYDPGRRAWLIDQVERLADLKSTMQ